MSWWKRRKCASCKKVLKKTKPIHELQLNTADGVMELEICDECSRFWDKSAEVLQIRGRNNNDDESV